MARAKRDPRTKEELLDRMLRFDFDGDIRNVGAQPASIVRLSANVLRLTFPESGTVFDLSVHRPREFAKPVAQRAGEDRSFAGSHEDDQAQIVPPTEGTAPPRRRRQPAADEGGEQRRQAQG